MSIHSPVRIVTILGLSLATTSVAFARNPPALARSQQTEGREVTTGGYRDSLARLEQRVDGVEAAHRGAGYRDSLRRFAASRSTRVASQR